MDPVYKLGWHIFSELAHGLADFRIIGAEKLRIDGPALIACNHASFVDPPFVGQTFDSFLRPEDAVQSSGGWLDPAPLAGHPD